MLYDRQHLIGNTLFVALCCNLCMVASYLCFIHESIFIEWNEQFKLLKNSLKITYKTENHLQNGQIIQVTYQPIWYIRLYGADKNDNLSDLKCVCLPTGIYACGTTTDHSLQKIMTFCCKQTYLGQSMIFKKGFKKWHLQINYTSAH